jgi:manganese/zinc/iron transport system permease protein
MEKVFNFLTFTDSNIFYILFGIVILTNSSAIIGTFIFLRNKSLLSDLISHSIFPGICLSFMVCGEKKILYFIIGAFFTSYISLFLVYIIPKKSKIKEDASIAIVLSLFFGIGIFLLTIIQKFDNSNKTGLNNFLFGNAASIIIEDLIIFSLISVLVIFTITVFFNQLLLISFDNNFSISIGLPIKFIEFIITFIIILSIISGIQVIGIILMSSILITPSVAARF